MPLPLSYPALKLVLEYVKVEKRIHLTSRSSFLQQIDKAIPVRAKVFWIQEGYLSLDGFQFDVQQKSRYTSEDKKNGKLLMSYLKGRSSVNVDSAIFETVKTSQDIPLKLDFTVNSLTTFCCNLNVVFPMINPCSFPLTEFTMIPYEPTNVDIEIVRSAKQLSITTDDELIGLEKLPNKSVLLIRPVTDAVRIIRYWMENGKEVETEFAMICSQRFDLVEMLDALQEKFQEVREELEEIDEHILPGFSIPLSSSSKLLVYGIVKNENEVYTFELVLKVV
ncbi:hypothetical protein CRE_17888 [Caenorhabditis remanei]|uniref:F-box domain-containing protein n=1 Tax=Caenorhabditis remanei TaxID=31234 RepID=E3MDD7_CAERE|nr:hypothetical protein CRE_17888 [Caenorhabditis remanei]